MKMLEILERPLTASVRCVAVAVLLALMALQAIMSMREKSVTVDEIMYIAAGHHHARRWPGAWPSGRDG